MVRYILVTEETSYLCVKHIAANHHGDSSMRRAGTVLHEINRPQIGLDSPTRSVLLPRQSGAASLAGRPADRRDGRLRTAVAGSFRLVRTEADSTMTQNVASGIARRRGLERSTALASPDHGPPNGGTTIRRAFLCGDFHKE
jgi:hypothetical protein